MTLLSLSWNIYTYVYKEIVYDDVYDVSWTSERDLFATVPRSVVRFFWKKQHRDSFSILLVDGIAA